MIMLRMLTGLAMSPITVLKLLAPRRRNRVKNFRVKSFRVSCMPDTQYPVRVECRGMCIDLPPSQAARLAEALQPGPDGPGSFRSRQGLYCIRWHWQNVRIQMPAKTVVEDVSVFGVWLNKRSAINLRRRILDALAVAVRHGFIKGEDLHTPVVPGDVQDNPFVVGERVVLQHGRRGTLAGTVLFISPAGVTLKWDNGPTCSLSGARAKDFGQLW